MSHLDPRSDADRHLAFDCWQTFNGNGDWWTCHLLRLIAKSDPPHQARIAIAFDREVMMFLEWERMNQEAFARKWRIAKADADQWEEWEREGRHGPEDLDDPIET